MAQLHAVVICGESIRESTASAARAAGCSVSTEPREEGRQTDPHALFELLRRLDIRLDRALVVADCPIVVGSAKTAGLDVVGIETVACNPFALYAAGARLVAESPEDLRRLLGRLESAASLDDASWAGSAPIPDLDCATVGASPS